MFTIQKSKYAPDILRQKKNTYTARTVKMRMCESRSCSQRLLTTLCKERGPSRSNWKLPATSEEARCWPFSGGPSGSVIRTFDNKYTASKRMQRWPFSGGPSGALIHHDCANAGQTIETYTALNGTAHNSGMHV